jgi:hypothetical protein
MNTAGRTLSYGEQKDLERRIQDLHDAAGGKELVQGVNITAPNKEMMNRQLKHLQNTLASQGVGEVAEKERVEMEKECRMIEDKIRTGFPGRPMPTWSAFVSSRPKDGPRHDKIVAWDLWFNNDPTVQQLVRRWKTLRRHLDPHDPKASHVSHLHPD